MANLPRALTALKGQATKMLPLLDMRYVNNPLKAEKLPMMAAGDKGDVVQTERSIWILMTRRFPSVLTDRDAIARRLN
ncbi:hypothetical protein ACJZ2D_011596 [Fusarium nematophilum]